MSYFLFHILFSSFLSLVGMIVGLLLGNIENWSSWIFCATAGIFLYVALVDMVPELNSGHNHPSVSSDDGDGGRHEEHRGERRRDSKVCCLLKYPSRVIFYRMFQQLGDLGCSLS